MTNLLCKAVLHIEIRSTVYNLSASTPGYLSHETHELEAQKQYTYR